MIIGAFSDYAEVAGWQFTPRTRYLMGEHIFNLIAKQMAEQGAPNPIHSWSSANSYERRYGGQDANGRRILIYRENAFGDALIVTALAHYVKHLYPDARMDVHAVPAMAEAWRHNEDVSFIGAPPSFDSMRSSDYHILLEGQMENDAEPEQRNCYDNMFDFCGLNSFDVPREFKRPHIVWGSSDDECLAKWKEWKPWKYVLWHVCPSSAPRMLPIANQESAIRLLADHIDVVMVGRQEGAPTPQVDHPRVHDWTQRTAQWRALIPMIRDSECVVAPDSSVLHAAAAFPDIPVVGLWASYHQDDRAKYYKNHTAVSGEFACPYAPCRAQKSNFPVEKCRAAIGFEEPVKWCCGLKAITGEMIANAVLKLI